MKKVTIYGFDVRGRKSVVRNITVNPQFIGIGKRGQIDSAEFKKLVNSLEPDNIGFSVVDM